MITLVLAGVIVVGSLTSVANTATSDAPDLTLKEPIPVAAGYGFRLEGSYQPSTGTYRSEPIPAKAANQAVQEVVDYYIAGLAPEWTVVERNEVGAMGMGSMRRRSSDRAIRRTASASRCMRTCGVGLPPWF